MTKKQINSILNLIKILLKDKSNIKKLADGGIYITFRDENNENYENILGFTIKSFYKNRKITFYITKNFQKVFPFSIDLFEQDSNLCKYKKLCLMGNRDYQFCYNKINIYYELVKEGYI